MKQRTVRHPVFLITGLLLAFQMRAGTVFVGWDSDHGFSPSTATISAGDTVVWTDNDPDFPTQVTSNNSFGQPNHFQFILANQDDTFGVTFDTTGTIGYSDEYGHSGSITITGSIPVSITLSSPRVSGGKFLFDATGFTPGKTNVLDVSTNLSNWTAMQTNVAATGSATFTNSVVSSPQFYRVSQLP